MDSYHENDMHNAKQSMWCLKLEQVYTHFLKKKKAMQIYLSGFI